MGGGWQVLLKLLRARDPGVDGLVTWCASSPRSPPAPRGARIRRFAG